MMIHLHYNYKILYVAVNCIKQIYIGTAIKLKWGGKCENRNSDYGVLFEKGIQIKVVLKVFRYFDFLSSTQKPCTYLKRGGKI
jgi:hypothetical protein